MRPAFERPWEAADPDEVRAALAPTSKPTGAAKVERLLETVGRVEGLVATSAAVDKVRTRPINVVSPTGGVTKVISPKAVLEALLEREGVTTALVDGLAEQRSRLVCSVEGCGIRLKGVGKTGMCNSHINRKRQAAMTPEQRSDVARRASASRTPEQRSESARNANISSARRSEVARRRMASMTHEKRSELMGKLQMASASRTPEQRSEATRKANASMTAEQRSENARKAWRTRRATPEE